MSRAHTSRRHIGMLLVATLFIAAGCEHLAYDPAYDYGYTYHYYHYPHSAHSVYYCIETHEYHWHEHNRWHCATRLPHHVHVDRHRRVVVACDSDTPHHHARHRHSDGHSRDHRHVQARNRGGSADHASHPHERGPHDHADRFDNPRAAHYKDRSHEDVDDVDDDAARRLAEHRPRERGPDFDDDGAETRRREPAARSSERATRHAASHSNEVAKERDRAGSKPKSSKSVTKDTSKSSAAREGDDDDKPRRRYVGGSSDDGPRSRVKR